MVTDREFRSDLLPAQCVRSTTRRFAIGLMTFLRSCRLTQKFAARMNKRITTIPSETMTALSRITRPGNIRELENFIERAVILSRGSNLTVPLSELRARRTIDGDSRILSTLEDAEREHIRQALQQANWLVGALRAPPRSSA